MRSREDQPGADRRPSTPKGRPRHSDAERASPDRPLSETTVLALQRLVGNAAVAQRLIEHEPEVQRSAVHQALQSPGRRLEDGVQEEMEARTGADFSDVRVHTDATAHAAAESVQAHAFTSGSDIVFQRGRYDTASASGKRMLAHELTHVKQQRSGPVSGTDVGGGLKVSDPSDRFELAAEADAERAMARPVQPVVAQNVSSGGELTQALPDVASVQRMEVSPDERERFLETFNQRHRMRLDAVVNGADIGLYASARTYGGSDHAEDALLDGLEDLVGGGDPQVVQQMFPANNITLVISDLAASPCTTTQWNDAQGNPLPITSNKGPAGSTDGCTERLIEFAREGLKDRNGNEYRVAITVECHHFYKYRESRQLKEASQAAVAAMQRAGIRVIVTGS
jgi:hypothetical protein